MRSTIKVNPSTRPLRSSLWGTLGLLIGLAVFVTILPGTSWAQEEVTSPIYQYRQREMSTGYYEQHEATPLPYGPTTGGQVLGGGVITVAPTAAPIRRRTYLADSHQGLRFYNRLTCIKCHPREALDLHTRRAGLTCRQCHGPEPIAGISHYYSAMNSSRRHAYICAKCHEGANVSFATFVVHEPSAQSLTTRESFPSLFYAYWGMLLLFVGTLAFFVPHSFMVGLRELANPKEVFGDFISRVKKEGNSVNVKNEGDHAD
jgi:hypothetical protein